VSHAREISLSSYTLHPGVVLGALVAAAQHGARVHVRLERDPLERDAGPLHRANAAAVAELRAAGADARLSGRHEPLMHAKLAVVDGVAWLDDRNWVGAADERIVRADDPGEVALTKDAALRRELDVIGQAGSAELDLESESFGTGAIYAALLRRAEAHLPTRVIVAGRELAQPHHAAERTALAHLAALGTDVRVGNPRHDLTDKLAVAAGAAWIGSANATWSGGMAGGQPDWGVASADPALVDGLRAAFERNWSRAGTLPEVIGPKTAQ